MVGTRCQRDRRSAFAERLVDLPAEPEDGGIEEPALLRHEEGLAVRRESADLPVVTAGRVEGRDEPEIPLRRSGSRYEQGESEGLERCGAGGDAASVRDHEVEISSGRRGERGGIREAAGPSWSDGPGSSVHRLLGRPP